ncbi:MAG TPA: phosphate ABC transporter substrate-binding protein [Candidatus Lachnoclostridium stercoravium]|uniref:Phosphate-binding protein n=1 Tax=Candidatus Lachnoclostridium stercoravium TaxID=2838633 RepID=A0A9D2HJX4_9FIRM|nr:phosphate ABC transporter substrate-binding protein [Candidatus Lachnoclostridium stercoravium]
MRRNLKKTAAVLGAAVLAMGMMAGCGSSAEETTAAETTAAAETTTAAAADAGSEETSAEETAGEEEAAPADLEGSITMAGSTSMEKFANALAESFMEVYPNVTVQAEFTGSSAGIEAVLAGQCDIGNSSRNLTEDEIAKGAAENIVAIDGIAIVTDAANTVSDLTKDQLIAIYSGETTNWSDLGGADQPIVVVGREAGSGTRGAFEEILGLEDACKYANELDSTGAVMAKVASTPGSIGYVSLDVLDDTVKALTLEGVEANEENIKSGDYFLSRPFVMATKGAIEEQSELIQALFDYVYSEEGDALIQDVGLITTN